MKVWKGRVKKGRTYKRVVKEFEGREEEEKEDNIARKGER